MKKILDHGETLPARRRAKPTPFISAAGLVLAVGTTVLGVIGRGIKGATRLLINANAKTPSKVQIRDGKNVQRVAGGTQATRNIIGDIDANN